MCIKKSEVVIYRDKKYRVCEISTRNKNILFIIDDEDFEKVSEYSGWYMTGKGYIACQVTKKYMLYLHNLIMNKLSFDGKGQSITIDHINRITQDNRKENLRIITQSSQNYNQKRRKREVNFITPTDI